MNLFIKKSLQALLMGLITLGWISCEDPVTFDIRDYTLTLSVQDGYRDDNGDLTFPELGVLVEGPGMNLWELTVQSEDGESIAFAALTGTTEYTSLPFKAFEEGENSLNIEVTAVEGAHHVFLDRKALKVQILLIR